MKKYVIVRTYPHAPTKPYEKLNKYLNEGYVIVKSNQFDWNKGKGNEYFLEKDV